MQFLSVLNFSFYSTHLRCKNIVHRTRVQISVDYRNAKVNKMNFRWRRFALHTFPNTVSPPNHCIRWAADVHAESVSGNFSTNKSNNCVPFCVWNINFNSNSGKKRLFVRSIYPFWSFTLILIRSYNFGYSSNSSKCASIVSSTLYSSPLMKCPVPGSFNRNGTLYWVATTSGNFVCVVPLPMNWATPCFTSVNQ